MVSARTWARWLGARPHRVIASGGLSRDSPIQQPGDPRGVQAPVRQGVAPVVPLDRAPGHPHLAARAAYASVGGVTQPAPAPRFSRTPGALSTPPAATGEHTRDALADWGLDPARIARLLDGGVARQAP